MALNETETVGWSGYRVLLDALLERSTSVLPRAWMGFANTRGRSLEEILDTPVTLPERTPHPGLERYLRHLLERHYLVTGPGRNLRENLGLLMLIPYLVEEPVEEYVAVLERDFYTHARGAAAWLPALRNCSLPVNPSYAGGG